MKKIMFNDKYGLTQAVLDGRKTQTRRAIRLKDGEYVNVVALDNGSFMSYVAKKGCLTAHVGDIELPEYVRPLTPNYFIGTEVAVAQPYKDTWQHTGFMTAFEAKHCPGYNNKMFVKAEKMPHRIKITNIRVEHLQDISEEDCLKEGFEKINVNEGFGNMSSHWEYLLTYYDKLGRSLQLGSRYHTEAYAFLIEKICGKGTWESNPWVFVYDFELIR